MPPRFQFQELPAELPARESSPTTVKRKVRDDISEAASVKRSKSHEPAAQAEHLMETIRDLQRQNRVRNKAHRGSSMLTNN